MLENIPSQIPTFKNGKPFLEYNQFSGFTDYTSAGEAGNKMRESVKVINNIPPALVTNQNIIREGLLSNGINYATITNNLNSQYFTDGLPRLTSSSIYSSLDSYDSSNTSLYLAHNAPGSNYAFLQPKVLNPAYVVNGKINLQAMKDTFRPTINNTYFADTSVPTLITDGLIPSTKHGGIAMPIDYKTMTQNTIQIFHDVNTNGTTFPSSDYVNIIRNLLPKVNDGNYSKEELFNIKKELSNSYSINESTKVLVDDLVIIQLNGKFYLLPNIN